MTIPTRESRHQEQIPMQVILYDDSDKGKTPLTEILNAINSLWRSRHGKDDINNNFEFK